MYSSCAAHVHNIYVNAMHGTFTISSSMLVFEYTMIKPPTHSGTTLIVEIFKTIPLWRTIDIDTMAGRELDNLT